jgi:electron transport complex protein RnfD
MQIFGGIGANPFNPPALAIRDFDGILQNPYGLRCPLINFSLDFPSATDPLAALKAFGPAAVEHIKPSICSWDDKWAAWAVPSGLALALGGIYLMLRGIIRWEISIAFIAGVFISAMLFNMADPARYARRCSTCLPAIP